MYIVGQLGRSPGQRSACPTTAMRARGVSAPKRKRTRTARRHARTLLCPGYLLGPTSSLPASNSWKLGSLRMASQTGSTFRRTIEMVSHLTQIDRRAFVFLSGTAGDNLESSDLGEPSQNLVLNPLRKVRVGFIVAQIIERQNGNRFVRHLWYRLRW